MIKFKRIAIVGTGPRGVVALERLIAAISEEKSAVGVLIVLFESSVYAGCGPNYAPDQPLTDQLNIPLREIPINERPAVRGQFSYPSFPSFQAWYESENDPIVGGADTYPPRADVGRYLQARFTTVIQSNANASNQESSDTVANLELRRQS